MKPVEKRTMKIGKESFVSVSGVEKKHQLEGVDKDQKKILKHNEGKSASKKHSKKHHPDEHEGHLDPHKRRMSAMKAKKK